MKKIVSLFLAIISTLALCACGSLPELPAIPSSNTTSESVGQITEKVPAASATEMQETPAEEPQYVYPGEVIVDNEFCKFSVLGVAHDSIFGDGLKVECENRSDCNMMFSWENTAVNGIMNDPLWAESVAPGMKSVSSVLFTGDVGNLDEVSFTLRVYDYDDWVREPFVEEPYTIYPTGLSADTVIREERDLSNALTVIDNENIKFVIEGTEIDPIWGYTVKVYMENKTDKTLIFSWNDVAVNGYMSDPFWASEVAPGMKATGSVSFISLEEDGITGPVESIDFTLKVYDVNDWMASPYVENGYCYNP